MTEPMTEREAFEILETMLHNRDRCANDLFEPPKVAERARLEAQALRMVMRLEA